MNEHSCMIVFQSIHDISRQIWICLKTYRLCVIEIIEFEFLKKMSWENLKMMKQKTKNDDDWRKKIQMIENDQREIKKDAKKKFINLLIFRTELAEIRKMKIAIDVFFAYVKKFNLAQNDFFRTNLLFRTKFFHFRSHFIFQHQVIYHFICFSSVFFSFVLIDFSNKYYDIYENFSSW